MNGLMRRYPFDGMVSLQNMMNRMMEDSFVGTIPFQSFGMDLALDMYETDNEVIVQVAVPGVKPEDIEVTVVGDQLTIKGESKAEEEDKGKNYLHRERRYGKFSRTITLPSYARTDNATAEFEHGVLTLKVPKAEEVKPKTVLVNAKS